MQQFQSIHYLRGVAALMVVIFHIHSGIDFMRHAAGDNSWLRGGVDIFFVISGFVMVASTSGKSVSPRELFVRRCQRIVPLYWLATLIMIMIMITAIPGEFLFKLGSMFFVPMANPNSGLMEPVVEPGWTLNYEMFFYALFALSLLIAERWRFWLLALLLISLATLSLIFRPDGVISFYTNPILLDFLFGMVIAKFKMKGPTIFIPFGFATMYFVYPQIGGHVVALGIPAACIVMGAVGSESKVRSFRTLTLIGDASYSIYLFHLLALGVLAKHWTSLGIDTAYFIPIAILFVLALALPVHVLIERPIIAFFGRINAQSATRSASTADSILIRHHSNAAFNIENVSAIAGAPNNSGNNAISTTTSA